MGTSARSNFKKLSLALAVSTAIGLTGCGGSSSTTGGQTPPQAKTSVSGGGTKGPLIGATVNVYKVDPTADDLKGALVDTGETGSDAKITGLELPQPLEDAYLVVFEADGDTTDLTTGVAPVISKMRTIVSKSTIESTNVYGTPLTELAVGITAGRLDRSGTPTVQDVLDDLNKAAGEVASTVGFGLDKSVNIFATPPVIDETTDTPEEQSATASYRAAIEALASVVNSAAEASADIDDTADDALAALAQDLENGEIDNAVTNSVAAEVKTILENVTDPSTLPIPNKEGSTVADVGTILTDETADTGETAPEETPVIVVTPPVLDADSDDDNVPDFDDAFPEDPNETSDNDGDGTGDNADTDDDNDNYSDDVETSEGSDPLSSSSTPVDTDGDFDPDSTDTDDDNDKVLDVDDDFPLDATETTDTDKDGTGDNADTDDDGDNVPDDQDAFPLDATESADNDEDGTGDNADTDDDNDKVLDTADAFPFDPEESVDTDKDGTGNNADTDDDGDNVPDTQDVFPLDATESADNDKDGTGDNADTDDDNDKILDTADAFPFDPEESVDTDKDGTGNNADTDDDGDNVPDDQDVFPLDATESADNDKDGTGDNADTDDDNDTYPDTVEENAGTDPKDAESFPDDADQDGIPDATDPDDDNDGVLDADDAFPYDKTESQDPDQDGIGSNTDNCPTVANQDQADADKDGLGDACIPEVDQAKQLVSDARTWVTALDGLNTPLDAFGLNTETISDAMDPATNAVIDITGEALAQVFAAIDVIEQTSMTSIMLPSNVPVLINGESIGSVALTKDTSGSGFAFNIGGSLSNNTVVMDMTIGLNKTEAEILAAVAAGDSFNPGDGTYALSINGTAKNPASVEIKFTDTGLAVAGLETFFGEQEGTDATDSTAAAEAKVTASKETNPTFVNFSGDITISQMDAGSYTGAKVNGLVDIEMVGLEVESTHPASIGLSLKKFGISNLTVEDDQGSKVGFSAVLNINNPTTFDSIAFLEGESTIHYFSDDLPGDALGLASAVTQEFAIPTGNTINNVHYSTWSNETCAWWLDNQGMYYNNCADGDIAGVSSPVTHGFDEDTVIHVHSANYFSSYDSTVGSHSNWWGTIELPDMETAESYLDATLTISGELDLAGYPNAIATITLDKTGLDAGEGTINISYDDSSLDISVKADPATPGTAEMVITNGSNTKMVIKAVDGDMTGAVFVNDKQVAVIAENESGVAIITYNDGYFESL